MEVVVYTAVEQWPELFNWLAENAEWIYDAIMWWYPTV